MTPIEKMCEAWWGADLGGETRSWKSATETVRKNHIKRMTAALRALAEMEQPKSVIIAGEKAVYGPESWKVSTVYKAMLLAAAEGETHE